MNPRPRTTRYLIGLILFFLFQYAKAQNTDEPIRLEFFRGIPIQVDSGCNGLYASDTMSLKKANYLLVTDLQSFAFVKIKGNTIKLKLIGEPDNNFANKPLSKIYQGIYKGIEYRVILKTTTDKKADETWESTETWRDQGSLEIIRGKRHLILKVHGISGC